MLTNPVAPMMMTLVLLNAGQNVQNVIIKMQLLQWFIEDYFRVFHMKRSYEHKNDHVFSENRFVKTNLIRFGVYLHFFHKKVEFIVDWLSNGYRTKYFQSNWLKCKKKCCNLECSIWLLSLSFIHQYQSRIAFICQRLKSPEWTMKAIRCIFFFCEKRKCWKSFRK